MQCPRCQHENRPTQRFCGECGTTLQRSADSAQPSPSYADMQRSLTEALARESATGEILRMVRDSPTNEQAVFEAIVSSAWRLLGGFGGAFGGAVYRVVGDELYLAAYVSTNPTGDAALRSTFPRPLAVFSPPGEAIRGRAPVVLTDVDTDGWVPDDIRELIRKRGDRSGLWVPLIREGVALGAIGVTRSEPGGFPDEQIRLLETFADQAVIAIENVRLFKELEARNRELTEALEQQTATSEILRVISQSPTDTQPVFDAIVERALRLSEATVGAVSIFDGELIHVVASNLRPDSPILRVFPMRPSRTGSLAARTVFERQIIHVPDALAEPEYNVSQEAAESGYRSILSVPMLRDGTVVGTITVGRSQAGRYLDRQIALLQTFADQAVIAIENVRLFKELETRNRDLSEALTQQTATSEILRTIAHSQTDVQPVFDTIVESAARLCRAANAAVFLTDGQMLYLPANYGVSPEALAAVRERYPRPLDMETTGGIAIVTRSVVHVPDIEEPSAGASMRKAGRVVGFRSAVTVPMLRDGEAVGAINVTRPNPGRFSDGEVALLKTFADQAVIAVENVRLFKELQARTADLTRSVDQLTALGEVGRAVSSTLDVETVLDTIVARATQLAGADGCAISEYDDATEVFHVRATHGIDAALIGTLRAMPLRKGEGTMGRAAETREPTQIADITVSGAYQSHVRDMLIDAGYRALLSVPLLREEEIIGSLSLLRKLSGEFSLEVIEVLKTFATQSALAIQNARLFHEVADKSRQLEAASRHKSEFLANMSHELRTPLNAILGFSEVLAQGMFGDVNEKQSEYLHDILDSGRHLLSLINDILDLSKIEAGRMELEVSEFDLPQAIQNALTLVRERALRRGIALHHVIDNRVAGIRADERKVKQVLLNLLSNAIKFTPEGGGIEVRAAPVDGMVEVSVTDTGVGIAPEDQEAVFEEFRQVGTTDKKAEGTGLGLALSRKFIELHGGRISVRSQLGTGSTFTFTLPGPDGK